MDKKAANDTQRARPSTSVVQEVIAVQHIPRLFEEATVYLYDPDTGTGQWVSPESTPYQRWTRNEAHSLLLFQVGELVPPALVAARSQGATRPYWRDTLRQFHGEVVCQAYLEQTDSRWHLVKKQVTYTSDSRQPNG